LAVVDKLYNYGYLTGGVIINHIQSVFEEETGRQKQPLKMTHININMSAIIGTVYHIHYIFEAFRERRSNLSEFCLYSPILLQRKL
jgi:hypothetical protein